MLRITVQQSRQKVTIKLEGRMVGPWVEELRRTWISLAPSVGSKVLRIDLCEVTFVDRPGKQLLREICIAGARFRADTAMTKYLVGEIEQSCYEE